MSTTPELSYKAFLVLAEKVGLGVDSHHLKELFPEVKAMFHRIGLVNQLDVTGIPISSDLGLDDISREVQ
jgi:hypothetical protein